MLKKYFEEFKEGTKTMFKEFFKKETNKKQRANMWSFSRIIIPIITLVLSVVAIATGIIPLFIASGVIAGFGAVTDALDGRSSRKHESSSEYGKLLDQATDKYFSIIVGTNVSFINPMYLIILLGELIIGSINIGYQKKYKNLDIKSTRIGKIKQWPLYICLALGYLSSINSVFLDIASISVILTFIFQLLTANSYLEQNSRNVKKLKLGEIKNIVLDEIQDEEHEKTLELEKKVGMTTSEKLEELRNLREEIIPKEENIYKEKNPTLVKSMKKNDFE